MMTMMVLILLSLSACQTNPDKEAWQVVDGFFKNNSEIIRSSVENYNPEGMDSSHKDSFYESLGEVSKLASQRAEGKE